MNSPIERSNLQRVVGIINGKGGVGKTTLTANIGGLLAISGWKVLLVDLDQQGNLGNDLGYRRGEFDDDGAALSKALLFTDDAPWPVKDIRKNLDVLVGGVRLEETAAALSASRRGDLGQARLSVAKMLDHVAVDYDIILLDCPPANDIIQSAAITAARYVLIPTKVDEGSLEGLDLTAQRFDAVAELNPDLDLLGVVIFDSSFSSNSLRLEMNQEIANRLGAPDRTDLVFNDYVRHAERVAYDTRKKGLLVHELDDKVRSAPKWYERLKQNLPAERVGPKSAQPVADSLQSITSELIDRIAAKEAETANV